MSRETRLAASALTGELPAVDAAVCGCADDVHRWSAPIVEAVDTARITRWRCTCPHCQCDGLHLVVDPTERDTTDHACSEVVPVGHVIAGELPVQRAKERPPDEWADAERALYERVLAGLAAL